MKKSYSKLQDPHLPGFERLKTGSFNPPPPLPPPGPTGRSTASLEGQICSFNQLLFVLPDRFIFVASSKTLFFNPCCEPFALKGEIMSFELLNFHQPGKILRVFHHTKRYIKFKFLPALMQTKIEFPSPWEPDTSSNSSSMGRGKGGPIDCGNTLKPTRVGNELFRSFVRELHARLSCRHFLA